MASTVLSPLVTAVRDARHRSAARKALERELSSYTSPGDLNDLGAILDRHPDDETAGIRRILAAQERTRAATRS